MSDISAPEVSSDQSVDNAPQQASVPDAGSPAAGTEIASTAGQAATTDGTATPPAAAAPAYTPNYVFTAYDKEHQFEDWSKPLITSKEVEDSMRSLYSKAYGFDTVKGKLQKTREEYDSLNGSIDILREHVKNRDFDSFFKHVNIPNEWIMEWAVKRAQYQNLSPEDRRAYDEQLELRRQNTELQRQLQYGTQQTNEALTKAKEVELDVALQSPEISQVMRDFDASRGKIGAFREQVIMHAYANELATGRTVSAKEAVDNLLALMGRTLGTQPMAPQAANANPNNVAKPVIPNIKASGGSPVKKQIRSIAELKEYAQQMTNAGQ